MSIITVQQLVDREVLVCVSSLVYTLAQGYGNAGDTRDVSLLVEQAFELSCPIEDHEEAAIQAGWSINGGGAVYQWMYNASKGDLLTDWCQTPQEAAEAACEEDDLEPYQREVFEHWVVTDWFGRKLVERGEKVDFDFQGLTVWARTTSGQGIASDHVVLEIHRELTKA